MKRREVTKEMTMYEVLGCVPGAIELFRRHGVNPTGECGPLTRVIRLIDTPMRCHLDDLDGLIIELMTALQARDLSND